MGIVVPGTSRDGPERKRSSVPPSQVSPERRSASEYPKRVDAAFRPRIPPSPGPCDAPLPVE
jgi:hypothetical protein